VEDCCEDESEPLVPKMLGSSRVAAKLAASQEGLSAMQLGM
jgi:hypothetical protein